MRHLDFDISYLFIYAAATIPSHAASLISTCYAPHKHFEWPLFELLAPKITKQHTPSKKAHRINQDKSNAHGRVCHQITRVWLLCQLRKKYHPHTQMNDIMR